MSEKQEDEQIVIFRVGPVVCCVDACLVDSIVHPQALHQFPHQADFILGVLQYQNRAVSIVNLFHKFNFPEPESGNESRFIMGITSKGTVGYWVDEIMEITGQYEEHQAEPPRFTAENIFERTMLWRDKLVLKTDFDRLFYMNESLPIKEWVDKDAGNAIAVTYPHSHIEESDIVAWTEPADGASEQRINALMSRGAEFSQTIPFDEEIQVVEKHPITMPGNETEVMTVSPLTEINVTTIFEEPVKNNLTETNTTLPEQLIEPVVESVVILELEESHSEIEVLAVIAAEHGDVENVTHNTNINGDNYSLAIGKGENKLSKKTSAMLPEHKQLEHEVCHDEENHDEATKAIPISSIFEIIDVEKSDSNIAIVEGNDFTLANSADLLETLIKLDLRTSVTNGILPAATRIIDDDSWGASAPSSYIEAQTDHEKLEVNAADKAGIFSEAKIQDDLDDDIKSINQSSSDPSHPQTSDEIDSDEIDTQQTMAVSEHQASSELQISNISSSVTDSATATNVITLENSTQIANKIPSQISHSETKQATRIEQEKSNSFSNSYSFSNSKDKLAQISSFQSTETVEVGNFDDTVIVDDENRHFNQNVDNFFEEKIKDKVEVYNNSLEHDRPPTVIKHRSNESDFTVGSQVTAIYPLKKESEIRIAVPVKNENYTIIEMNEVTETSETGKNGDSKEQHLKQDKAVEKVIQRIERKHNTQNKSSGLRIPMAILVSAIGVFSIQHYWLNPGKDELPPVPSLQLLPEITEKLVRKKEIIIETVKDKYGEEYSIHYTIKETTEPNKKYDETPSKAIGDVPNKNAVSNESLDSVFNWKKHTVVNGDTLWELSKTYLHDPFRYSDLARWNHIKNPNKIYPGDKVSYNTSEEAR